MFESPIGVDFVAHGCVNQLPVAASRGGQNWLLSAKSGRRVSTKPEAIQQRVNGRSASLVLWSVLDSHVVLMNALFDRGDP